MNQCPVLVATGEAEEPLADCDSKIELPRMQLLLLELFMLKWREANPERVKAAKVARRIDPFVCSTCGRRFGVAFGVRARRSAGTEPGGAAAVRGLWATECRGQCVERGERVVDAHLRIAKEVDASDAFRIHGVGVPRLVFMETAVRAVGGLGVRYALVLSG